MSEIKYALEAVNKYGDRKCPTGDDRAQLVYAAVKLAPEVIRLQAENEALRGWVAQKDEALEVALHELVTLHNMDASDDSERLFRNPFTIDTSMARDKVRKALSSSLYAVANALKAKEASNG